MKAEECPWCKTDIVELMEDRLGYDEFEITACPKCGKPIRIQSEVTNVAYECSKDAVSVAREREKYERRKAGD